MLRVEDKYLSVTALTKYIKKKFDVDKHLTDVWLRAEISNFKHHSRGHMYMTLKDDNASIRAVMFQQYNQRIAFEVENGMNVLVRGYISVFEAQGQYQFYITSMEPDGIGALHLAYEQLKEKLLKEGLFDASHKKDLPKFPERIAILTSPTGAAIRDILTTIERRYPLVDVLVVPVYVQGTLSKGSIVKAIEWVNETNEADLIILGRGGGSIEELWSFNEEEVARAIFRSRIPIISAVGHETDFTISDLVADLRAPTPTAAAELAVPSKQELIENIIHWKNRLKNNFDAVIKEKKQRLLALEQTYVFKYPHRYAKEKEQLLDRAVERLNQLSAVLMDRKYESYRYIFQRFQSLSLNRTIDQNKERTNELEGQLHRTMERLLDAKRNTFSNRLEQLEMLNPVRIMSRGYSIVYHQQEIVKQAEQIKPGDQIEVKLAHGSADCIVKTVREDGTIHDR